MRIPRHRPKIPRERATSGAFEGIPERNDLLLIRSTAPPRPPITCVDCGAEVSQRDRSGFRKRGVGTKRRGVLCAACEDKRSGGPLR